MPLTAITQASPVRWSMYLLTSILELNSSFFMPGGVILFHLGDQRPEVFPLTFSSGAVIDLTMTKHDHSRLEFIEDIVPSLESTSLNAHSQTTVSKDIAGEQHLFRKDPHHRIGTSVDSTQMNQMDFHAI